jgi:hypothetical protein
MSSIALKQDNVPLHDFYRKRPGNRMATWGVFRKTLFLAANCRTRERWQGTERHSGVGWWRGCWRRRAPTLARFQEKLGFRCRHWNGGVRNLCAFSFLLVAGTRRLGESLWVIVPATAGCLYRCGFALRCRHRPGKGGRFLPPQADAIFRVRAWRPGRVLRPI